MLLLTSLIFMVLDKSDAIKSEERHEFKTTNER